MTNPSGGSRPESDGMPPWQTLQAHQVQSLHSEVQTTRQALHDLTTLVQNLSEGLANRSDSDHENRLRALEERRWPRQDVALIVAILAVALQVVLLVRR
ncbi:hypothetical protein [Streptomyces hawaiiensis]|uniref:hypothetical protein n=1 Tax=Streptomyces hawaiiensis TaxID=67305 RepID=UPI003656715E